MVTTVLSQYIPHTQTYIQTHETHTNAGIHICRQIMYKYMSHTHTQGQLGLTAVIRGQDVSLYKRAKTFFFLQWLLD